MAPLTTYPDFGESTTATEVTKVFSEQIKGKHVLLVGVSPNSLGEHMAVAIASHEPALLILASRTASNISQVIDKIKSSTANIPKSVLVDLSSQASIRTAAKDISSLTPKLDVIINNAALNIPTWQGTKEGIETHFGTNHIGLFLLTNLLLPVVLSAASSNTPGSTRIVNLTSAGHRLSPIRFSDYNFKKSYVDLPEEEQPPKGLPPQLLDAKEPYNPFMAYAQSKTANILFSLSLEEGLGGKNVRSYSVHPGSIWTGLARNLDDEGQKLIKSTGKSWKNGDQGAAGTLVAAFDPALNEPNGVYMADCQYAEAAPFATDPKMAQRLWALSEELVGEKFSLS
ncbi:NAD(P)-binding protein [Mollisia scopiformis]|uniref:NAD(P)-binding protein n=1 Tax=Mollisia scopiformis TaxID=149040 RepID=A0A194WZP8_MOLSC|nr:NAD(P)-binding protein [Mollisia scopiformis]KUJ13092.1 NAD(P)-binding protein [Mollisia scopiformis]